MERNPLSVCLMLFPDMTQLDFTGPFEVFARMPDTQIHLVSKDDQAVLRGCFGIGSAASFSPGSAVGASQTLGQEITTCQIDKRLT